MSLPGSSGSTGTPSAFGRPAVWWSAVAIVLAAGVGIRVTLMPRIGHVPDTVAFYEWASDAARQSVASLYLLPATAQITLMNYPPVYVYLLSALPPLHDALYDGPAWSSAAVSGGLRREVLRLVYGDFASRVRTAGVASRPIGAKAYADTVADMEWAGLGDEFRNAQITTYGELAAFFGKHIVAGPQLGAAHRSVLVLLKLPAVLADVALAALLFAVAWRWSGRWPAVLAAAGVFLSPVVIHDSAYWGQVDSIPTALVVTCLLALISRAWWLVSLLLVVALLVKPQAIVIAPVVGAVVLVTLLQQRRGKSGGDRRDVARLAAGLATGCLAVVAILAPIVRGGALAALADSYTSLGSQYPYLTLRAFNFWWFFTDGNPITGFEATPRDDVATSFGVTPKAIGFAMLLAAVGFVVAAIVKRRGERATVVLGALMVAMAFFCLPTEIHERYGYPLSPLAIVAALAVSRRYWWVAAASALTHFANAFLGGMSAWPGGAPTSGVVLFLASMPTLTYAIAAVNLALFALVAADLYRLACRAEFTGAHPPPVTTRHGGTAAPRARR